MSDIFYDLYQAGQIAGAQGTANQALDKVGAVKDDLAALHAKIARLALVNAAMWELVREKTGLSDVELKSRILEIDARDGVIDGKMGSTKATCRTCGKVLHPKHDKCLYCGEDNKSGDVFRV